MDRAMQAAGNSCDLENDQKNKKKCAGKYALACTLLATISSMLLGYDIGVMSGAILFIKDDLKLGILQEEVVVGSLNLISSVGAATAGRLSDRIGRRRTMTVAAAIFLVGAVIMAFSPSFGVLMAGRALTGIGVGFGMMIAPVYAAELSPASIRGSLVSLTEIFINSGILLGYIVSFALEGVNNHYNWRVMLGLAAMPAVVLAVGVIFLPESPRWLVTQKRIEEARVVLRKTSDGDVEEADLRLKEIIETACFDDSLIASRQRSEQTDGKLHKQGEGVWREFLRPSPPVRRMLIVALGVNFFQQASGIDAIVYYSPVVFNDAGITSKLGRLGATVGVGFTKLVFILVATFLLDRSGRKNLLLLSGAGLTLSLITVAVSFIALGLNSSQGDNLLSVSLKHGSQKGSGVGAGITIAAICAYVAFFSIGFGPINWVVTSEIFPLRLRSQAMGLSVTVNRLISGTVALTFLTISNAITPAGTFFLFAAIGTASVIFIYFLVPETKGKTLEELEKFFQGGGRGMENDSSQELQSVVEARDGKRDGGESVNNTTV